MQQHLFQKDKRFGIKLVRDSECVSPQKIIFFIEACYNLKQTVHISY